ncbi:MAG TPA: sigma-70 family RNA polymerase sigma factor [Candidatus Angelobacter sp.]|nr:sigma-70 family RNA polymerase sigma factor [Candidatus Angelobacter sp.]
MTDFHGFYQQYAPIVRRFAVFLCGNPALADDITSETFVRVWTAESKIRESTVKAYLFTIARNLYRDFLRRNARRADMEEAETMPDPRPSLESQVEQRSELDAAMALLQQLPEIDRAALLMHVQEEMPYQEIGEALGLPPVTVKVKVHRARLKLLRMRTALRPATNLKEATDER